MKIDAHQHFWQYDPEKHAWIEDHMSLIRRDFLPDDLWPIFQRHEIEGCVAVQADQSEAETDFLLSLAEQHDFIKGVVGWVDIRADRLAERLSHYKQASKLVGFRHVVQAEPDVNFLLREDFLRGIAQLQKYNFSYDILIFPHQLGAALELTRRFPKQRFVIDHIAKPYIKDGFYDGWATLMRAFGERQNVYCKLSGMLTEADWQGWTYEQLEPYMTCVMETFGAKRLLYGSDWPVCLLAGEYAAGYNAVLQFIAKLSPDEQAAILGQNAIDFYHL
ncbi:MAG: amidohydrolase family protein [Bacteroidota bacterium]